MDSRDLMRKIIKILEKTYYGDVRFDTSRSFSVGKNKSEENINTASSIGLCIRVFSDNKWHYLGFNEFNEQKILDETKKLVRRVGNKPSKLILQDSWETDTEIRVKKNPNDVSQEEKIKIIRGV